MMSKVRGSYGRWGGVRVEGVRFVGNFIFMQKLSVVIPFHVRYSEALNDELAKKRYPDHLLLAHSATNL